MPHSVLPAYGLEERSLRVDAFGSGLINNTWKVTAAGNEYILQRINDAVFKEQTDIANNISLIGAYLRKSHPGYKFVSPVTSNDGDEMIYQKGEGYFRMFRFVKGSHSKNVVETPEHACEAATQFGRFTRLLHSLDISKLKITIPGFHDLALRYQQFLLALEKGNKKRISKSETLIRSLVSHVDIVTEYGKIKSSPEFKLRVTHHDTKISNVLFDAVVRQFRNIFFAIIIKLQLSSFFHYQNAHANKLFGYRSKVKSRSSCKWLAAAKVCNTKSFFINYLSFFGIKNSAIKAIGRIKHS